MVMSLLETLRLTFRGVNCIVRWRSLLFDDRVFGGSAILCLLVALLFRSAPYPSWHWQGDQISKLLKGIRGGHAEKFTLSVANCPGLFDSFPSSHLYPEGGKSATEFPLLCSFWHSCRLRP
jgi:hypothetical protein